MERKKVWTKILMLSLVRWYAGKPAAIRKYRKFLALYNLEDTAEHTVFDFKERELILVDLNQRVEQYVNFFKLIATI